MKAPLAATKKRQGILAGVFFIFVFPSLTLASQGNELQSATGEMGHLMTLLIIQLAVIMVAARLGGVLIRRLFRGPAVLGELMAGMIIGPHALGQFGIPGLGPLFPALGNTHMPVSPELYGIAILASIILLFISGLETDLSTFIRYSLAGMVVGAGGLVFSFILGDMCAVWFGVAESFTSPGALFMGTIATATSVGLTARILTERRKMSSPEGVTILAAAVLDDVAGIVILAVVIGMAKAKAAVGTLDWGHIGILAGKAVGFWLVFMIGGLLMARRVTRVLNLLRSRETIAAICLGLALLVAGLSEMAGLAMIIGAYIMGLALSGTDLVNELQEQMRGLYNFLIPVFFCVMGMLVDFTALKGALLFGVVYSIVCILSKILGCGIPAMFMGFTTRGALRVGAGMVPRAEVALIVAGVALSAGVIGADIFGVAILMSMITTITAPPLLVHAFQGGSGTRGKDKSRDQKEVCVKLDFPSSSVAEFVFSRIVQAFRNEEFYVHRLHTEKPTYQIRKETMVFTIIQDSDAIRLNMAPEHHYIARMIVLEEILAIQDLLESAKKLKSPDEMGTELMAGMFG